MTTQSMEHTVQVFVFYCERETFVAGLPDLDYKLARCSTPCKVCKRYSRALLEGNPYDYGYMPPRYPVPAIYDVRKDESSCDTFTALMRMTLVKR